MADNSWRDLETWDRVKWARSRRYESANGAAEALGMKDGTYRCYERGPDSAKFIALDYKHARLFAREFRVRWEWLLDDDGEPWLTPEAEPSEEEGEDPERPTHFLRAWREYRGLTVADLAKKSGLSAQSIVEMEQANDHSTKKVGILAAALGTTAGYVLDHDPHDVSPEVHETFAAIPKERRGQALEILKTFRPYQKLR
ncbi:MAG TPA: helix-turn-helix transcriptional regulator [Caulobacteraceae bacterium]|jgi:transcriptional regulator with XRE-family HTH domain|nr:helix-turn-helix transcriptional regulator [Caulobacteraceae bacterium]